MWKELLHFLCSIKPKSESICLSVAEAETVKCFCSVDICVYMYAEEKKDTDRQMDRETEEWSCMSQVEIPLSLPLLFVSTAGISQN